MLHSLKNFFAHYSSPNYKSLMQKGGKIIDVRTKKEYASGHIAGSINVPLNELREGVNRFSNDTILITCCASGVRSASAKKALEAMGFRQVHNGGGWSELNEKI